MANEVQIYFNSLDLAGTNYAIGNIAVKENKPATLHNIPLADGSIAEEAKRKSLTISIEGSISGSNYDELRTDIDTLKAALQAGIKQFTTDDDRYVNAQLQDFEYSFATLRTLARFKATFIAHYPFWQAITATTDTRTPTSGVGYTLANNGNARARVKVEVTAPGGGIADNCQIANSTTGQTMKYRGTIAAAKVLKVDNRTDSDDYAVTNDAVDDTANFEGDFLELAPGNNTIVFTGTASASVKFTYKDCYY
jgi:phage-related protein